MALPFLRELVGHAEARESMRMDKSSINLGIPSRDSTEQGMTSEHYGALHIQVVALQ